jgi:cytochrome c oxidase subunit 1
MFGGAGMAFLAGLHYWFPKMTGRMYPERPAKIGWLLLFAGFNLLYFTMFVMGLAGMPRRYFDYPERYFTAQVVSTAGGCVLAAGVIVILGNLLRALRRGPPAPENPWGGKTLEWRTASPPPPENFTEIPVVTDGPYAYD